MIANFKPHSRSGYTLFELLLTLSLVTALLALITTAIGLFEKYSTAGRAQAERSQISRALLDRMEIDLRSIVYREPPVEEASSAEIVAPGALNAEQEFKIQDPDTAYRDADLGIIGDERSLLLHVDRSSGWRSQRSEFSTDPAGIHYVIWTISKQPAGTDAGVLSGRLTTESARSEEADDARTGLARLSANKLPMQFKSSVSLFPELTSAGEMQGRVLASEVKTIRFRYLDQDAWHNAWDSVAAKRLPRAIEVTLDFKPRREIPGQDNSLRVVIPVTLSEPVVPQLISPSASGGR